MTILYGALSECKESKVRRGWIAPPAWLSFQVRRVWRDRSLCSARPRCSSSFWMASDQESKSSPWNYYSMLTLGQFNVLYKNPAWWSVGEANLGPDIWFGSFRSLLASPRGPSSSVIWYVSVRLVLTHQGVEFLHPTPPTPIHWSPGPGWSPAGRQTRTRTNEPLLSFA